MLITLLDAYAIASFLPSGKPETLVLLNTLGLSMTTVFPMENFYVVFFRSLAKSPMPNTLFFRYFGFPSMFSFVVLSKCLRIFSVLIIYSLAEGPSIALGSLILATLYGGFTHAFMAMWSKGKCTFFFWFIRVSSSLDCSIFPVLL